MFKAATREVQDEVDNNGLVKYPTCLNFYDLPPLFDVSIEEFETCALDRLRVLVEVESSLARNRSWDELKSITKGVCAKYMPLSAGIQDRFTKPDRERRKDHLSHFVLRLAFCRSEELRRRFIKAESTLFKVRYDATLADDQEAFLASRDFNWIQVLEDEKNTLKDQLEATFNGSTTEFEKMKYYKVRWTRVPDLVERRKVFLKFGWAYVPTKEQSSIIFHEFEVQLEKELERTARILPRLDEDTRLVPILNNISQGFLAGISSEWVNASGSEGIDEIKAEMVDELAHKTFPLCMRIHHENLRRDKHIKHFGRLEYGLFLKVLGLSIDEAIAFWRKSFSRMDDNKFNKEYKYNIRHSFGLEGKRANYPAKSCVQLLAPGSSDHGCPYKNYDSENLSTALLSLYSPLGLRSADLPEIMATVKGKHYHVACTGVFELTHASCGVNRGEGIGKGESVTHPNQYAARSRELRKAKDSMSVD